MMRSTAFVGGVWLLLGCVATPEPASVVVSDGRYVMGTVLEITLRAPDEDAGDAALAELFGVAHQLEGLLTLFDAESPLSRLNRAAGQGVQAVDAELAELLSRARDHAALTGGAFDVTVGPLAALWKRAAVRNALPSEAELSAALARVGWENVRVLRGGRVALETSGVAVDLGGIAKAGCIGRILT